MDAEEGGVAFLLFDIPEEEENEENGLETPEDFRSEGD